MLAVDLSQTEFDYFRELRTGTKSWSPEGKEQCTGCGSLGHMHRRDCSVVAKGAEVSRPST